MSKRRNPEHGYTMIELMVVMLIFSVVMTLISVSFSRMVRGSGQLLKSAETDIGGLIGLELMRSDMESAGFGLYWKVSAGASLPPYIEAPDHLVLVNCPGGCPNASPSTFDDRTYSEDPYIPRAYRVGNNVSYNGSDYLVLKATAMGANKVSRVWGYLNYSGAGGVTPPRDAWSARFKILDRVIVLKSGISEGREVRELVLDKNDKDQLIFTAFYPSSFDVGKFSPKEPGDNFLVYGIDKPDKSDVTLPLRFPFNRADYYVSRPDDMSPTCAPGTGVLYKTVITHSDPSPPHKPRSIYPILDCVADMQMVLYMDSNGDSVVDYRADGEELETKNALETRNELKEIRVYILAQQGRRDDSYLYPVSDPERAILVGDPALIENPEESALGRIWSSSKMADTFGSNWRNYRWRLYTIVVQPKNL